MGMKMLYEPSGLCSTNTFVFGDFGVSLLGMVGCQAGWAEGDKFGWVG